MGVLHALGVALRQCSHLNNDKHWIAVGVVDIQLGTSEPYAAGCVRLFLTHLEEQSLMLAAPVAVFPMPRYWMANAQQLFLCILPKGIRAFAAS